MSWYGKDTFKQDMLDALAEIYQKIGELHE